MTTSPTAARGGLLARHRTGFWVAVALVTVLVAVGVVTFVRSRPGPGSGPGATAFPLKVSGNGRYLVDQRDEPFFYAGDTCWTLLSYLSLRDAKRLIDIRRAQGFSAVQTVLEPLGRTTTERVRAEPFVDGDVTRPDEGYWAVVDQIMAYAARRGMLLYVVPIWMSSYGEDGRTLPTTSQLQVYMTWIGHRYRDQGNIIWALGGDDEATRHQPLKEAAAKALKAADPNHLLTYHPRRDDWTFKDESWLDVYSFQKNDISPPYSYEQVRSGHELSPTKPVLDAEPPYEPATAMQEGDVTTPLINRKFGWWAALSGALGVTYGGPSGAWKINKEAAPDWDADIDRAPARHTGNVRRILTRFAWATLVPDWDRTTVTGGRGAYGGADYAPAGRADDGTLVVAYAPTGRTLEVDLSRLSGPAVAEWFDPTTGEAAGPRRGVNATGTEPFATPGRNAAGDDDWVLVISTSRPG